MKNTYLYPLERLLRPSPGQWTCLCHYWAIVVGDSVLVHAKKYCDPEGVTKAVTVQANLDQRAAEHIGKRIYPDAEVRFFELLVEPSYEDVIKYGTTYYKPSESRAEQ